MRTPPRTVHSLNLYRKRIWGRVKYTHAVKRISEMKPSVHFYSVSYRYPHFISTLEIFHCKNDFFFLFISLRLISEPTWHFSMMQQLFVRALNIDVDWFHFHRCFFVRSGSFRSAIIQSEKVSSPFISVPLDVRCTFFILCFSIYSCR